MGDQLHRQCTSILVPNMGVGVLLLQGMHPLRQDYLRLLTYAVVLGYVEPYCSLSYLVDPAWVEQATYAL